MALSSETYRLFLPILNKICINGYNKYPIYSIISCDVLVCVAAAFN